MLRRAFKRVAGLPCWNVKDGLGSVLMLEFGEPSLRIRGGNPKSRHLNRRRVHVKGTHTLLVEMCDWELRPPGGRRFHSEQSRAKLRAAARWLDGQVITEVEVAVRPLRCTLVLDDGSEFRMQRYRRSRSDDALFTLFSARKSLSLRADGSLEDGPRNLLPERREAVTPCRVFLGAPRSSSQPRHK